MWPGEAGSTSRVCGGLYMADLDEMDLASCAWKRPSSTAANVGRRRTLGPLGSNGATACLARPCINSLVRKHPQATTGLEHHKTWSVFCVSTQH